MMKLSFLAVTLLFCCSKWSTAAMMISLLTLFSIMWSKHDLGVFMIYTNFSWDSISSLLTILTLWTSMLMLMSSVKSSLTKNYSSMFVLLILILNSTLVLAFSVNNILVFYIMFEASLIPTFMLILGWGYQPERIQAGVYLLMYTIMASLPLLLTLLMWQNSSNTLDFYSIPPQTSKLMLNELFAAASVLAFLVKLPLYFVHLWLPKAHVEAPVAGSMILASVLLKLGGYGIYRMTPKLSLFLPTLGYSVMTWSLVGGVIISLLCLTQTDLKHLIALSSVAHMALVAGGLLTGSQWGVKGAIVIMMGHGFCSSGLFCIANMAYERIHSRSMKMIKGLMSLAPVMTLFWFLLSAANMAAPPSLNLLGEISSIISLLSWSNFLVLPLALLTFFAAASSLLLYSNTQHGKPCNMVFPFLPLTPLEILTLILHSIPLYLLSLNLSSMLV
uniref:NADH-ubiquinone oxidoreductase chain 4 n=1 Tax=Ligia oceanica TaxID=96856 RepID=Q09TF4_LIGOC|nr:NADH dehydrogenase subunit 4 [Ligia oceanica]